MTDKFDRITKEMDSLIKRGLRHLHVDTLFRMADVEF